METWIYLKINVWFYLRRGQSYWTYLTNHWSNITNYSVQFHEIDADFSFRLAVGNRHYISPVNLNE